MGLVISSARYFEDLVVLVVDEVELDLLQVRLYE
jgi:hypothetical protein